MGKVFSTFTLMASIIFDSGWEFLLGPPTYPAGHYTEKSLKTASSGTGLMMGASLRFYAIDADEPVFNDMAALAGPDYFSMLPE